MIKRVCPVCQSQAYNLIFHDKNRREGLDIEADFVACTECGMKYLTHLPSFEEIKEKYTDIYESQRFQSVSPPDSTNKNILDIGCNFGEQLKDFYEKGWQVYGTDLNPLAIQDAKKNLPEGTFAVGTIEACQYPSDFFDTVRTSHVLEHIYDVDSFLKEVYRILKPNGECKIYVPNGDSLEMKVFGKYSSQSWVPFHLNLFGARHLRKKLKETGFSNVQTSTHPLPWWWILSIRQYRERINTGTNKTNFSQTVFVKGCMVLLYIPLSIVSFFGFGEELQVIAEK